MSRTARYTRPFPQVTLEAEDGETATKGIRGLHQTVGAVESEEREEAGAQKAKRKLRRSTLAMGADGGPTVADLNPLEHTCRTHQAVGEPRLVDIG